MAMGSDHLQRKQSVSKMGARGGAGSSGTRHSSMFLDSSAASGGGSAFSYPRNPGREKREGVGNVQRQSGNGKWHRAGKGVC